jgi:hypothetical protein
VRTQANTQPSIINRESKSKSKSKSKSTSKSGP